MMTVSVTEVKSHSLQFLIDVGKAGESLLLTKRAKPFAMVCPPPVEAPSAIVFGKFRDKGRIIGEFG